MGRKRKRAIGMMKKRRMISVWLERLVGKEKTKKKLAYLSSSADALATTALCAEVDQGRAFDIATGGDGHDHVFALDQVFVFHIAGPVDDFGAPRHREEFFYLGQFVGNDPHDPLA